VRRLLRRDARVQTTAGEGGDSDGEEGSEGLEEEGGEKEVAVFRFITGSLRLGDPVPNPHPPHHIPLRNPVDDLHSIHHRPEHRVARIEVRLR
jgi:hypothetical protein